MPVTRPSPAGSAKLCLLGCSNFHAEMQACVDAEAWPDVVCAALPARCGRPPLSWDEIAAAVPQGSTHLVLLGRACLGGLGAVPADFLPTRLLVQDQCFHLIAGRSLVDEAVRDGSYLVSAGWLRNWREQLRQLGFDEPLAGEFFRDFAKKLLFLDTGTDPQGAQHFQDMRSTLGLAGETVTVHLDYARLLLKTLVLEWRLEGQQQSAQAQQRQHAKALANHVSALDLLGQLTRHGSEPEVLAGMEELFRMLFAPGVYHYLPTADASASGLGTEVGALLATLQQPYAWTPTQSGFVLRLMRSQRCQGFVVVDDFEFPHFKEQYLNLALAMMDVCSLSIESARTRKRLIEAEKMASLGVMVAGIAHEINTPVGVGVLAASTLQHQTRDLAASFEQRRMTQTELRSYLQASTASADLIASSLERVGKLIASFRRVSVNGHRQNLQTVSIAACLSDIVTSFGERLQKGQFTVQVSCPESLTMQGYPGDLESVFTNLMANSLQHGFKDRTQGCIRIAVEQAGTSLQMVYSDDGNGLSADALQRIFDPFFTTDMQNGMGLGMHLVYNLITQRMGGSISVDPQAKPGVRFLMEIPTQAV